MNELIWFSIPGAILLLAIGIIMPNEISNVKAESIAIIIVSAPIIGFIVHQLWRTIFEMVWGFHTNKRTVIFKIMTQFDLNNIDAFLVWELTFYSKDIPDSFLIHDRGTWHYIMSFSSCALASFLSFVLTVLFPSKHWFWWALLFVFLIILFITKTAITLKSLNKQELGIFNIYKDAFIKIAEKIK